MQCSFFCEWYSSLCHKRRNLNKAEVVECTADFLNELKLFTLTASIYWKQDVV